MEEDDTFARQGTAAFDPYPISNFVHKAAVNLLLSSSPYVPQLEGEPSMLTALEQTLMKPDFSSNLDFLGPVVLYFLGVDADKGIVLGDSMHAISCRLRGKALQALVDYIEEHQIQVQDMVGMKILLNPNGERDFSAADELGVDEDEHSQAEVYGAAQKNEWALKLKLVLKSQAESEDCSHSELPLPPLAEAKRKLNLEFKMELRLEASSLKVLDLSVDRNYNSRKNIDLKRMIVKQKPAYIDDDPDVLTLSQSKFLEQQRFQIRNQMAMDRLKKAMTPNEEEASIEKKLEMLSISDLVALSGAESGLENASEQVMNVKIPKDEDKKEPAIEIRALEAASSKVMSSFVDVNEADQDLIDSLTTPSRPFTDAAEKPQASNCGRKPGLAAIRRAQNKNQGLGGVSRHLRQNKRIYVNESTDITESMIESEKMSVIDLILERFPQKPKQAQKEEKASADIVGMGTSHAQKQRELARFRKATNDRDMEDSDLLNMLGGPAFNSQAKRKKDTEMLDLEEDSEDSEPVLNPETRKRSAYDIDFLVKQTGMTEEVNLLEHVNEYLVSNTKQMTASMFQRYIEFMKTHRVVVDQDRLDVEVNLKQETEKLNEPNRGYVKKNTDKTTDKLAAATGGGQEGAGMPSKLALLGRQRQARLNHGGGETKVDALVEKKAPQKQPQLTPEDKALAVPGLGQKRTLAEYEDNQKSVEASKEAVAQNEEEKKLASVEEAAEAEVRAMDAQVVQQLIDGEEVQKRVKPSKPGGKPGKKRKNLGFI